MKKVLVANRGEIAIRVFRAAKELGLATVGIYAKEDDQSLHRFKADEAYQVGTGKKPIEAYLDIEDIIRIAKKSGADAIHPGYGFLSENLDFAIRCQEEGLIFVGPKIAELEILGDKIKAKEAAFKAGLASIPGSHGVVQSLEEIYEFADQYGYPIMVKAALGGGGRGMRIIRSKDQVAALSQEAAREAQQAFGSSDCYVEKYIENPQHIEVQILGDMYGNLVHLYERDCSVQRRHQKVVEVAPCLSISDELRERICRSAATFMKEINYLNAGTVEFLLDGDTFYFIEVNPRVQVEHTITELITGIDIVQAQLRIAAGQDLYKEIGIPKQEELHYSGAAIQCRVTTEDPENNFLPDTGRINTYRSPGGFGIRLDAGNAFQGNIVTPYFDSLLVKVCSFGRTFEQAVTTMERALIEFRIRGVKTNIPFMKNVIAHPTFQSGMAKTTFIDSSPELFVFPKDSNRGNKTLAYISEITINGYPGLNKKTKEYIPQALLPSNLEQVPQERTAKSVLDEEGADALNKWLKHQKRILITDTTFRDAHQSLLATRMRSQDLTKIAALYEKALPNLFSAEVWGGATFDTAYRFLTEDPWQRLKDYRQAMPNTLLQMLFRASNAVGYTNYPDNVIEGFIKEAAASGVDVFRIFDSLNWLPQMEKSIQAVRDSGKIAQAAICYTGDVMDPKRQKYSLAYYKNLAKELEAAGAHMIAVKDMAGLLKPQAAYELISTLKEAVSLPIQLHTHDTSGNGIMTLSKAVQAGVDVVDLAMSSMSGGTSQPSLESLYYALDGSSRQPELSIHNAEEINHYWQSVRQYYHMFDTSTTSPTTEVYHHEMPGGQYTNLLQQATSLGLEKQWDVIKDMYHRVNLLFGDIIKVTPSSKVVGDMALFMVQNNLDENSLFEKGDKLDFPDSVISYFRGDLGQPIGGFPPALQKLVLKDISPITKRPGLLMEPVDFDKVRQDLSKKLGRTASSQEALSYLMYPKVFLDYQKKIEEFGDVYLIDTPTFFSGMRQGEAVQIQYAPGKVLNIQLVQIGEPDIEGNRIMFFRFNGQGREIIVKDRSIKGTALVRKKAEPTNPAHIAATMPGSVLKVLVEKGQTVTKGQALIITEAMKMETTIQANKDGRIDALYVKDGDLLQNGDLLMELLG